MIDKIEIVHKEWLSTAGYKQECWEVQRNGWELGRISLSYNHKWLAMLSQDQYKSKYFVQFNNAQKWIERNMANIRPISELYLCQ